MILHFSKPRICGERITHDQIMSSSSDSRANWRAIRFAFSLEAMTSTPGRERFTRCKKIDMLPIC